MQPAQPQKPYKIDIREEIKAIEFAQQSGIQNYILLDVNDDQKRLLFEAGYHYVCMRSGLCVFTWLKNETEWLRLRRELRN